MVTREFLPEERLPPANQDGRVALDDQHGGSWQTIIILGGATGKGIHEAAASWYYVADGVRLYSQETWRVVTQTRGVQLVEQHIDKVVDFYISQSQASNHAVREAACICTAELGTQDCLKPHVRLLFHSTTCRYVDRVSSLLPLCAETLQHINLLETLLKLSSDNALVVQSAGVDCLTSLCQLLGRMILRGRIEHNPISWLDELFTLFFANLGHSIPSVRQGAAAALTSVTKAYALKVSL
ncbi:uncharacterized protein LOC135330778 [Halichondria panicea]|uniref:uncharacterized protein LOC135330778 n=1 Tax=Halichondria panicea TaxID=6063 RepID=UPI00312B6E4C